MRFSSIAMLLLLCGCTSALHDLSQSMPVLGERCEGFQCMTDEGASREARAQAIIRKEQIRLEEERRQKLINQAQKAQPSGVPAAMPAAAQPPTSTWDAIFGGQEEPREEPSEPY